MKCYCDTCKKKNCDLRDQINFCEDCADYFACDIKGGICGTCDAGHYIECNNGFELPDIYDPYPEYDEFQDNYYDYEENEEK